MDVSQLINVLALAVALTAVVSSTFLSWRALRLTRNANHLPVSIQALETQRTNAFLSLEEKLWEELPHHDASLGFRNLPEPLRGVAWEVGFYYQNLSCLAEFGFADWDFVATQVEYRLQKTWKCIQDHARVEREYRGSADTLFNAFEAFATRMQKVDMRAVKERLNDRGRASRPSILPEAGGPREGLQSAA